MTGTSTLHCATLLSKALPNYNSSDRYWSTPRLQQGQVQSPQNTPPSPLPWLPACKHGYRNQASAQGAKSFPTGVQWGEQNLPAGQDLPSPERPPKGCGWRSECRTKGRSIIDLPIVEAYHGFPISLVFITKPFSPEKLPNRYIIHACSGLPVGLSRSVRASNAPDPIGLGPHGDFREGMLFCLRPLAARLPQYRLTQ